MGEDMASDATSGSVTTLDENKTTEGAFVHPNPSDPREGQTKAPAVPVEQQTVKVKVADEEKELKVAELQSAYEESIAKSHQAEQAKQKAQEIEKESRWKVELANDLIAAQQTGDTDALRRAFIKLGGSEEAVEKIIDNISSQYEEEPSPSSSLPKDIEIDSLRDASRLVKLIKQSGQSVDDFANVLTTGIREQSKTNRRNYVEQALKRNTTVSKMIETGADIRQIAKITDDRLQRYLTDTGSALTADAVNYAISEVSKDLTKLGVPMKRREDVAIGDIQGTTDFEEQDRLPPERPLKSMFGGTDTDLEMTRLIQKIHNESKGSALAR